MTPDTTDTHEHYDSPEYQKTVELERLIFNGMTAEEVYEKEALFALRATGMTKTSFGENEGILDVASGAGNHAFVISDALDNEVPITLSDPATKLGKLAQEKFRERQIAGIREQMHFLFDQNAAKMQNLSKSADQTQKTKLITILGYSFVYNNVRESEEVLRNMYNLLEPGGSIVIQWRQGPNVWDEAQKERMRTTSAQANQLGVQAHTGEIDGTHREYWVGPKGEKYYFVSSDCDCPDPEHSDEYERIETKDGVRWKHLKTGIESFAYSRVLHTEDGKRIEFPKATIHQTCWEYKDQGIQPLAKMLNNVGFEGVQFKEPQSESAWLGRQRMLAVVARKPA